jgi:hypothetical protein
VPSSSANSNGYGNGGLNPGYGDGGYRPATPNKKGQYSDAVLNELESQNDGQVEGILGKVRMLKDVGVAFSLSLGLLCLCIWRRAVLLLPLRRLSCARTLLWKV